MCLCVYAWVSLWLHVPCCLEPKQQLGFLGRRGGYKRSWLKICSVSCVTRIVTCDFKRQNGLSSSLWRERCIPTKLVEMSVPNRHLESRDTALEKINKLHKPPSCNSDPTLRGLGCLTPVVPPPLAVQERASRRREWG